VELLRQHRSGSRKGFLSALDHFVDEHPTAFRADCPGAVLPLLLPLPLLLDALTDRRGEVWLYISGYTLSPTCRAPR